MVVRVKLSNGIEEDEIRFKETGRIMILKIYRLYFLSLKQLKLMTLFLIFNQDKSCGLDVKTQDSRIIYKKEKKSQKKQS